MRMRATSMSSTSSGRSSGLAAAISAIYAAGGPGGAPMRGAWYERATLATLYQDSTGTTPVSAAGQPIGLALDKSLWLVYGAEQVTTPNINGVAIGGPSITSYATGASVVAGKFYEISAVVSGYSGTSTVGFGSGGFGAQTSAAANGPLVRRAYATASSAISVFTQITNTANFTNISIREIPGNHQLQATTTARPLYQTAPARAVFDGVDDVLNTTFAAALGANCTVGRAIPGVGAQITTAQNISTTFADSVTASALAIFDGPLTAGQTASLTAYLNQQAGYVAPAAFDPASKSTLVTLSENNALMTSSGADRAARSVKSYAVSSGKFYFEVQIVASSAGAGAGVANVLETMETWVGGSDKSIGVDTDAGNVYSSGSDLGPSGEGAAVAGDVIGVCVDRVLQKIWFRKNGTFGAGQDPVANTGGFTTPGGGELYVMVSAGASGSMRLRTTAPQFTGAVPAGYTAWGA